MMIFAPRFLPSVLALLSVLGSGGGLCATIPPRPRSSVDVGTPDDAPATTLKPSTGNSHSAAALAVHFLPIDLDEPFLPIPSPSSTSSSYLDNTRTVYFAISGYSARAASLAGMPVEQLEEELLFALDRPKWMPDRILAPVTAGKDAHRLEPGEFQLAKVDPQTFGQVLQGGSGISGQGGSGLGAGSDAERLAEQVPVHHVSAIARWVTQFNQEQQLNYQARLQKKPSSLFHRQPPRAPQPITAVYALRIRIPFTFRRYFSRQFRVIVKQRKWRGAGKWRGVVGGGDWVTENVGVTPFLPIGRASGLVGALQEASLAMSDTVHTMTAWFRTLEHGTSHLSSLRFGTKSKVKLD